ncbi:hypothetical protein LINGRAPRIM_LOCUS1570 [Linum grandiflorum]
MCEEEDMFMASLICNVGSGTDRLLEAEAISVVCSGTNVHTLRFAFKSRPLLNTMQRDISTNHWSQEAE